MNDSVKKMLEYNRVFVDHEMYQRYATTKYPDRKIAILSCMDTRMTELLPAALGIKNGDVKLIKNAGGQITHPYGSVIFSLLVAVYELGVDTILTSGQQADCTAGADLLRALVAKAGEDVQILVGAGVNAAVIRALQPKTGANAFHLSAKRVENSRMQFRRENVPMGLPGLSEFSLWRCNENAVRAAREAFDACCGAGQEART